jgi:tRNA pseudouridine13 synthase
MTVIPLPLDLLPYAWGEPQLSGVIRQQPQDFLVEEILGFEPQGEGEHVFLWVEKTALNTAQVAEHLARQAKIAVRQVSYAGMKDRHAVARQWFSLHLPGNQVFDAQSLHHPGINVIKQARHLRKLRRGAHRGNRFVITIAEMQGPLDEFARSVEKITVAGVPNYFGEQRFGRKGMNLLQAQRWFAGEIKPRREQRGIYLSVARSYLFNQLLAQRVKAGDWNRLLDGELVMLDGSHSLFAENNIEILQHRLLAGDIHPTGPMYGQPGSLSCAGEVAEREESVLKQYPALLTGLQQAGLKAERRALRVIPKDVHWQLKNHRAEISFSLPPGCFATSVVRELVRYPLGD